MKALISVKEDYTKDFETMATIAAYDENGDKMDVDIIPSKMKAKVKVNKTNLKIVPSYFSYQIGVIT